MGRTRVLAIALSSMMAAVACSRPPPDSTPDGAVRAFVDKMESATDDRRAMREAYMLLGPHARQNLSERAERASRGQGRRYEPYEMLAEGRFGLKFRPTVTTARIEGENAVVDVRGESTEDRAEVKCTREGPSWRVEPDLPDILAPIRRADAGP